MFIFTKILLAATLFVVVASNPVDYQWNHFPTFAPPKESVVRDEYVLGDDVKGAEQISNSQSGFGYSEKQNEIELSFRYPYYFNPYYMPKQTITKIVVLINQLDDDATFEVRVLDGGIGQSLVSLQVVGEDTTKLQSRVLLYGVNSE